MQQRIVGLFRLNLCLGHIGCRHICPGVAVQADGADMQEGRFTAFADIFRRFLRDAEGLVDIQPVAAEISKARAAAEIGRDPACRCLGGNADAIVFADPQQRHRDILIRSPACRVDRALRGRMIGRCIAKTAHHDRIVGQLLVFGRLALCQADRIGRADRLGQMAGDGRCLRRNGQRFRSQHLVAAAGNRVFAGTRKAEQHIPGDRLARHLFGPLDLERGVAVMKKCHIGRAQRRGNRGHCFMPRRTDGVKPLALALHRAAGPVQRAGQAA